MALAGLKLTDAQIAAKGVVSAPDKLTGKAEENKKIFDRLIREAVAGVHNGLIDALCAPTGAGEIGAKLGKTLAAALLSDDIDALRMNADGVLEVQKTGDTAWVTTGSTGHLILDDGGAAMPQRKQLQFADCTVQDNGTVTLVRGMKGDKGDTGAKGDDAALVDLRTGVFAMMLSPEGHLLVAVNTQEATPPLSIDAATGHLLYQIQ